MRAGSDRSWSGADVTVIIPAWNAAAYIAETLASVLAQTTPPGAVIVVDDGSTDGTADAAQQQAPQVQVRTIPNAGVGAARNIGWRMAHTPWVAFVDADDLWAPDKLERQLTAAGEAALVYAARHHIGDVRGARLQTEWDTLYEGDIFEALLQGNCITISSALVRRDTLEVVGGFSEDRALGPCADWDLWLRIAHDHPVAAVREALVAYREHDSGMSRSADAMNRARLAVLDRALRLPRATSLSARARRRAQAAVQRTNSWQLRQSAAWGAALACGCQALLLDPWHPDTLREMGRALARRD